MDDRRGRVGCLPREELLKVGRAALGRRGERVPVDQALRRWLRLRDDLDVEKAAPFGPACCVAADIDWAEHVQRAAVVVQPDPAVLSCLACQVGRTARDERQDSWPNHWIETARLVREGPPPEYPPMTVAEVRARRRETTVHDRVRLARRETGGRQLVPPVDVRLQPCAFAALVPLERSFVERRDDREAA